VSRVPVPCCGWWCEAPILPGPIIATCPYCGHWLMDAGQGEGPRIVSQEHVRALAETRPDVAEHLGQITMALVHEKPCCHGAHGHA
jgi:hypothetical protein